ncbi:MAG: class I SAM-dependent RNA methyltransferase [Rhodobacteraceae bacterium]|nr:class I SAM-dependent RNA methyltransferase [Paracoccaceae bacterium]
MTLPAPLDIFCACPPGLEDTLAEEMRTLGFAGVAAVPGGARCDGGWDVVMQANLWLRGATRVLVRIAEFRALHLAQLDKRARKVGWAALLRPDVPVRVEATCRKSRIYHAGAAAQRVGRAIAETTGAPVSDPASESATLRVLVRIDDDLCTISIDSSGAALHQRGLKQGMGKAPLRETLAAPFLRQCGFDGAEPVADPMCGSGTFVIEAAEIATGLAPGRARRFAFEQLAWIDATRWSALRDAASTTARASRWHGYGADRDDGAIRMARENAERAGVADMLSFERQAISAFAPPEGPPGLVMVNPPYGARIGNRKLLFALYGSLGQVLRDRFSGWRVGLVTSDGGLAKATGLPFLPSDPPVPHGGLKITLHRTAELP